MKRRRRRRRDGKSKYEMRKKKEKGEKDGVEFQKKMENENIRGEMKREKREK